VIDKFILNAHGGWTKRRPSPLDTDWVLYNDRIDLSALRGSTIDDSNELAGKVAIVTGAGRNIGRAIALTLARFGASILVNTRSNRAEADEGRARGRILRLRSDRPYRRRRRRHGCSRDGGCGTGSFWTASIFWSTMHALRREKRSPRWTMPSGAKSSTFTLDGAFHCTKACLPALRKGGAGTIVNIAA